MNVYEIMNEGAKGLAGAALAVWMPTLVYSVASNQFALLYLVACSEALGAIWGWMMFKKSSKGLLSCVPVTRVAKVATVERPVKLKKAA